MDKQKDLFTEILHLITSKFACQKKFVPLELRDGALIIGAVNPNDTELINDLEFLTGKNITVVRLSEPDLFTAIENTYGQKYSPDAVKEDELGDFQLVEKEKEVEEKKEIEKRTDDFSVISLVNQIITQAIDKRASDIHVEAYENLFRIRYRIDGVLQETANPPIQKKQAIVSRLKIMADLDYR